MSYLSHVAFTDATFIVCFGFCFNAYSKNAMFRNDNDKMRSVKELYYFTCEYEFRRSSDPMNRHGDRDGCGGVEGEQYGSRKQNVNIGIAEGEVDYGVLPEHYSPARISAVSRVKYKRRPNQL
ncbi:hypothetical protein CHS0354_003115 [Potamilus streckersoni]|uniref:Uncharacterized protein n=1 Tax=Potamilus streckersoni TaxID=2493646 RepID=A0AAE0VGG2_9BIVA|nr:hypothetical protein CHS0354_003115 [Potamilus streckersoni]